MTLSANQLKQDWKTKQYQWNEEKNEKGIWNWVGERIEDLWENIEASYTIKLNFLEIKTFKMIKS